METKEIVKQICSLLHLSEQRYYELMFEAGEEYFAWRCNGYNRILQAFRENREIWNWWKIQYWMMDSHLILSGERLNIEIYRAHHLGLEYYPHQMLVKLAIDNYDKVVQGIIEKERSLL